MLKKITIVVIVVLVALTTRLFMFGIESQKMNFDQKKSHVETLSKCVSLLNCYEGSIEFEKGLRDLELIIKGNSGNVIIASSANYLYFTNKSYIFGFIDDVEFSLDEKLKKLHYRSSSRVGKSDLGANKKRIDGILAKMKL